MRGLPLTLALTLALAATPAAAGKPEHAGNGGKGKGKGSPAANGQRGGGGGPSDRGDSAFSAAQRSSYFDWYTREYHDGCPPGLAKKNNGCLPPGLAKKRYAIGAPLPYGVVLGPLPSALAILLGAPPPGYRYGILDGDVVKLTIGTALVVDAIEGLANR
jgi:hypothetical protein